MGLRLEGRGCRSAAMAAACWNPSSFETRCEAASLLRMRGARPDPEASPPHPCHPGRSAAESRDLSAIRIGSQSPHPEEQTRWGLRLEGRGWRWPRWFSLLESLVLRDAMRSRMAPQDEGFVLFDVDNIPISAILRSLFTQEGTLPERSVAGWGGGACGGGVPLHPPGRPPESGLAQQAKPCARRKRLSGLPRRKAVSLPALDYAGAVSESALRREEKGVPPWTR